MGWLDEEEPGHEGYLVGLVPLEGSDFRWRELTSFQERDKEPLERVRMVQVGCECGWRSPRIHAPLFTEWFPYVVSAPDWFDEVARMIWKEHIQSLKIGLLKSQDFDGRTAFSALPLKPMGEGKVNYFNSLMSKRGHADE